LGGNNENRKKHANMKSNPFTKKPISSIGTTLKKTGEWCEEQYLLFVMRFVTITTGGYKISEFSMISGLLYRVITTKFKTSIE